jgi:hypothetical protein
VDLTSWQFDLAFNPIIVQANLVTEGPFMSAFGATLFIPGARLCENSQCNQGTVSEFV